MVMRLRTWVVVAVGVILRPGMPMPANRIVVFDLDGTLIDSAPAIAASVNHVRAALARAPLPVDVVRGFMGDGIEAVIERALAVDDGGVAFDGAAALQLFLRHHESGARRRIATYPGADALLRRLDGEGHVLALCTNKLTRLTTPLIAELGWTGLFRSVVCGDTLATRKPDPASLLLAIERCGGGCAVFVGDTHVDVATAANARVPFILVHRHGGYGKGVSDGSDAADDLDAVSAKLEALYRVAPPITSGGTSAADDLDGSGSKAPSGEIAPAASPGAPSAI